MEEMTYGGETRAHRTEPRRQAVRPEGQPFKDLEEVGRSLDQDQKRQAKHDAKPGQGDRGDRKK